MKLLLLQFLLLNGISMSFSIKSSAQVENPSQTQKVTNYLTEVYTNCPQYVDSIHIARGIEILSRIQIHTVEENQYPECLLLSSVALKNKCNPSLSYDQSNFNFETFNPFKYLFAFYSTQTAYFRVDGTNYIIEIKPIK